MKSKGIFTRVLSAILCAIMIIGMVPVTVFAEETASAALVLDVADVTLALDGTATDGYYTVDVPINVTANSGFNALSFDVTYDENLTLTGWTNNGAVMADEHNKTPTLEEASVVNPFTVVFVDSSETETETPNNSTATGELITLHFQVADTIAAGTTLSVSITDTEAYVQGAANADGSYPEPTAITTSVAAGGITTEEFGKVNGESLTISWNGYYYHDHTAENGSTGVFTNTDNAVVVNASSTGWLNDGCADFTITNIAVPDGVNADDIAPNHLNIDIKTYTGSDKYDSAASVIITAGGTSRSYDIDFANCKNDVTRIQLDLTKFGAISNIDSVKLTPFAYKNGVLSNVEVRIDSVSYSYKALEAAPERIVYDARDLTYVGIADPKALTTDKWTSYLDNDRGLWVVDFAENIAKKQHDDDGNLIYSSMDGDRVYISFPAIDASIDLPYIVVGIQVPSKITDKNFNVYYNGGGGTYSNGTDRTWGATYSDGAIGTSGIGKQIFNLATDTSNYGVNSIYAVASNAWGTAEFSAEAGENVYVQYVAFFKTLEDAQNYEYIAPIPYEVTFMVDGNVYATQTVVGGETFVYPETDPNKPGQVFVGWDVEESVVKGDTIVNAIFGSPAVLYTMGDGMTVTSNGDVYLEKVAASANEGPYYRFTANPSGEYNDSDWAKLAFDFSVNSEFDITTEDVLLIRYRTNLSGARFAMNPWFGGGRIWGGSNPYLTGDGEWHSYVYDLSEGGFNGGELNGGDLPTDTWAWAIENDKLNAVQIRPFYWLIPSEDGYVDIQYVAFFDSVAAANAYEYIEPTYHEVKFLDADGAEHFVSYVADGSKLTYPANEPTAPDGYRFVKWNVSAGTEVTGDLVVSAIFAPGTSAAPYTILYGSDITYTLGGIYQSTIEYSGTTAIFEPEHTSERKDLNWANDGNALVTATGLAIPTTYKYYVIGMTTYINNDKHPNYVASATDNLELYVDGTLLGDYIDVDLASHEGETIYAHVIDASSLITSGTSLTAIRFDPIPNNKKSNGSYYFYGADGYFALDFIAAFETKDAAQAYADAYNTAPDTTSNVTVTVNPTEGGSVIGTSGDYAVGAQVTFTAVPAEGYLFDGWYSDESNEALETDLAYTLEVPETATTLEARFVRAIIKTYTNLKVEAEDALGSVEVDNTAFDNNGYVQSGTEVIITAKPVDDNVFGYWKRVTVRTDGTDAEVYLGLEEELGAYGLGANVTYQPVFYSAGTTGKTVYIDATDLILSVDGAPTVEPTKPGYTFSGWATKEVKKNENDVAIVTVYQAVYTVGAGETAGLTVYAANGDTKTLTPSFNELITVDAGADNVVWTLRVGNKTYPVSYNREYSFRYRITAASATLTATAATEAPKALLTGLEAVRDGEATRFVGAYYVPEAYTVTGHGMLLTSDDSVAEDMIIATGSVIVGNIATSSNAKSAIFVVNKNNTADATWYGRPFLMYTDGDGNKNVIYADTITITVSE